MEDKSARARALVSVSIRNEGHQIADVQQGKKKPLSTRGRQCPML